jgi:hypothetical protein
MKRNFLGEISKFLLILVLITGWIFSGWPRIWQNPFISLEIQEVSAATTTYDFSTCTPGTDCYGEHEGVDSWAEDAAGKVGSTKTPSIGDSAAQITYTNVQTENGVSFTTKDPGYNDEPVAEFFFDLAEDEDEVTQLDLRFVGYENTGGTVTFRIWNYSTTAWEDLDSGSGSSPFALTGSKTSNIANYIGSVTPKTTGAPTLSNAIALSVDGLTSNESLQLDYVKVDVQYSTITVPTVTTQAVSNVEATTAKGNGTITATGGANATRRGFQWDVDSGAPYANDVYEDGDFGTGDFDLSLTDLPTGTTIYYRAYATNPSGTGYGSELSFLTKPAAPTNVVAADGSYTNKVVVTWTKSTGASGYRVYRDTVDVSGLLGDVATYDDTGADAPTITAGSSAATDGSSTAQVDLSLSGTSVNNGTAHTYKVVAVNATGNSNDSSTDTGYRGHGSLTYQWQRSSGDSDADYANIDGATFSTYGDTEAPAPTITAGTAAASDGIYSGYVALSLSGQSTSNGTGRYYKCVLNATGAAEQTSASDRGYRGVGELTYQWQRSVADSDENYSNILDATTASYDDTDAPADGSGRYYRCVENADGASQEISSVDRGHRIAAPTSGAEMVSNNYLIWSSYINVGGHPQTSNNYKMRETIGGFATGGSISPSFKLNAGWQPMQETVISLTSPSDVTMDPAIGGVTGGTGNGQAVWTVTTDSPSGYTLAIKANTSPALQSDSYSFANYTPAGANPDYSWLIGSADSEFGFTPEGNDIVQEYRDDSSTCNTGADDTADKCWYGFSASDETIAQSFSANHPSGTTTTVKFRAESGSSHLQPEGTYQATITVTATAN